MKKTDSKKSRDTVPLSTGPFWREGAWREVKYLTDGIHMFTRNFLVLRIIHDCNSHLGEDARNNISSLL